MGLGVEGGAISIELRVARFLCFRAYWVGYFGEGFAEHMHLIGSKDAL